jgi:hypothetical protein
MSGIIGAIAANVAIQSTIRNMEDREIEDNYAEARYQAEHNYRNRPRRDRPKTWRRHRHHEKFVTAGVISAVALIAFLVGVFFF